MTDDAPTMDELTVAEVREQVSDVDDPDVLETLRAEEEDGQDRKTAKEAIDDRLDALEADDEDDDGKTSPFPDNPHGEFVHVKVPEGGGHVAGHSFAAGEVKEVKFDAKVQRALTRGKLQLIK